MRLFLVFLIGLVIGAAAYYWYVQSSPAPAGPARTTAAARDKLRDAAATAHDSVSEKLQEWKLTPSDIRADLAKTGQVVRSKGQELGAKIDDTRVVAVIKAKYVLDSELSARSISVECHGGEVTLTGTVGSTDLVGRAVALALDTRGVQHVAAHLSVQP